MKEKISHFFVRGRGANKKKRENGGGNTLTHTLFTDKRLRRPENPESDALVEVGAEKNWEGRKRG